MARPSAPALFWLFLRTALRRFGNRYLIGLQKLKEARSAKKGGVKQARTATAHRQQGKLRGLLGAGVMGALILFFLGFQTEKSFLAVSERVRGEVDQRGAVIPLKDYDRLERHDQSVRRGGAGAFPYALERSRLTHGSDSQEQWKAHYEAHGLAGFRQAEQDGRWGGEAAWMSEEARLRWFHVGGLLAGCAALYLLFSALGLLNKNINGAEPSLLWLFDFPVPRAWLFGAKVMEAAFDNIGVVLLSLLPAALFWQAGVVPPGAILAGVGCGILLALNVAALRVVLEVLLLQGFKRRTRGVLSGLVTVLGVVLFMVLLYGGQSPQLVRGLLRLADALPDLFWWNPLMLGLGADPEALTHPMTALGAAVLVTALFTLLCVKLAAWLTAGGFEPAGESAIRVATPVAGETEGRRWLPPLIRRELLRLRRQPSALIQMLAAPAIMFLIQYFQNGGISLEKLGGNPDALAATIYGFSVYLVLGSGMSALGQEIKCVVFMLSLPTSLAEAFRAAARLAGGVAIGLALALFGSALAVWPEQALSLLPRMPFILVFLWLLAETLRGIQLLGISILSDTRVTLTARSNYLTLILAASAGHAVYVGELWTLSVLAVLIGLLNYGVWQKVRAELPYLTEPVENPPPRLHLMHGMMALFFFFVGQNLVAALSLAAGAAAGEALVLGYVLGGTVVALVTVGFLARDKVAWRPQARGPLSHAWAGIGLGWLAAVLMGGVWLAVLRGQGTFPRGLAVEGFGMFALAVVAAPIVEEVIFRGLVYQGLRQTMTPFQAALLSSLLFTIVHPGMSAPCVFLVALANAVLLEKTGRLWTCMVVHAGYNAVILALQ